MKIQKYMRLLVAIAIEHPDADVKAFDPGDDYHVGGNFDASPYWADGAIFVDGVEGDEVMVIGEVIDETEEHKALPANGKVAIQNRKGGDNGTESGADSSAESLSMPVLWEMAPNTPGKGRGSWTYTNF